MWLREKNNNNGKNAEQEQLTLAGGPAMMKEHHRQVLVLDWPADEQMAVFSLLSSAFVPWPALWTFAGFLQNMRSMLPFYKNQKMERQCKTETAGRSNYVCICGWKNSNWLAVQRQVTCLSMRSRHLADILKGVPFPRAWMSSLTLRYVTLVLALYTLIRLYKRRLNRSWLKEGKKVAPAKTSGAKDIWRKARAIYCMKNVVTSSTYIFSHCPMANSKGKITSEIF